jgi:hypothetical protein
MLADDRSLLESTAHRFSDLWPYELSIPVMNELQREHFGVLHEIQHGDGNRPHLQRGADEQAEGGVGRVKVDIANITSNDKGTQISGTADYRITVVPSERRQGLRKAMDE